MQAAALHTIGVGSRPCKRQPWPWGCPLRPRSGQSPLVAWPRAAAPCGLAVGVAYARRNRPYRRQPFPRATIHASGCPCKGAFAMADRPLVGGLGRSRLPLAASLAVGGRPWGLAVVGCPSLSLPSLRKCSNNAEIVYPCIPDLDREDERGQASSSLTIQMEKMKEVKRPL
ncbi:hypothetical protein GW17_00056432 [Ensete ventricosum]|nr:hypothetical protein GW17_00056432 [Ensete ventricosum]